MTCRGASIAVYTIALLIFIPGALLAIYTRYWTIGVILLLMIPLLGLYAEKRGWVRRRQ